MNKDLLKIYYLCRIIDYDVHDDEQIFGRERPAVFMSDWLDDEAGFGESSPPTGKP
ncbi:MAG: hypothetical protein K2H70_04420 [Bacteroidales bacterium]|nr:hypothetical protein [Bacteroidales bacterium]